MEGWVLGHPPEHRPAHGLVGGGGRPRPPGPEQLTGVVGGVHHRRDRHDRPQRVSGELKGGDDTEVAASPAYRPKQVGVLGLAGPPELPVGRHDLHRAQVVAGQPVRAVQPADPAAQRQPSNAGGRDNATRNRQPERLGLPIDITPGRTALDPYSPSVGIDPHATHH